MILRVLLVVSAAASAFGGCSCWSDSACALDERCNLRALPRYRCGRRPPLRPWSPCVGRENCCPDGFECRGRLVKSCQPLIGECEAVEQGVPDLCRTMKCNDPEYPVCTMAFGRLRCVQCKYGAAEWKKDCNTCTCSKSGRALCTKKACLPQVCDGKAKCGGILGRQCPSRNHVCMDDPDDDCDPANGGADCEGCCVYDMCKKTECCSGKVCELDTQGKAACVPAPVCEPGSTWKEDCNTCSCHNGRPICTLIACTLTPCTDDKDCPKDKFCRQEDSDGTCLDTRVCVKKVGEGERCNGFTLPCFFDRCQDGLTCKKAEPTGDLPGTCVPDVCDGKTKCSSKGAECKGDHLVCIDDPTDDCDPAKDGADCDGCCVTDMCKKKECCKEEVCKLDSRAKAECVPRPECREGARWKKDCNTCYCRGGKVVCTKKACLPKVCDGKAKCGGILGRQCPSRNHVCMDDPDDDCDPANGGADCEGCCVYDMCRKTECCSGKVCELDTQGKAACVPAPVCEPGSTWKEDCNTCSCHNGRPICTLIACTLTPCTDNKDCPKDKFCRQEDSDGTCLDTRVCVKKVGEGEKCNGFTLPCFFDRCQDGLTCKKAEPTGDLPGTCVPDVCDGKMKCRSKGAKCPGRHLVCIDDPTDDCDPAKDGADCDGCCVTDMCKKKECCKEEVCKLDSRAKAECVPRPECREGARWKKDCNTCYCRGGKVVCTEIACPPKVCDGKAKCHGGAKCDSPGHVCIDDPDDDCDPSKKKAHCGRCCVLNMCLTTRCSQGHVCKLDEQGKAECVPIPECREGARWKKDCNTCYCRGGEAVCTEIACDTPCKTDAGCAGDEFCRPQPGSAGCLAKKTCVKRAGLGETCSEQQLLCRSVVCLRGLQCHTDGHKSTCVANQVAGPNVCTPYTEEKPCLWWQCYNAATCSCMKDLQVNCFADPCQVVADCAPGYTCKSSYCGGCNHQCILDP